MSRKFLRITKPTKESPSLQIAGNGTYPLRNTFRENNFKWNHKEKCWQIVYNITDKITFADLNKAATLKIDAITIAASLEGISVNVIDKNKPYIEDKKPPKRPPIDFNAIKNVNNTYPDGSKIIRGRIKYYEHYDYGHSDPELKQDVISPFMHKRKNRIELRGSTYYNRDWLKKTFHAKFDYNSKVWWVNADKVNLKKVSQILDDFGVLDKDTFLPQSSDDESSDDNHNKHRKKVKKRKKAESTLKRRRMTDTEDDSDYYGVNRAKKRRKVVIEDSDDESESDMDLDEESDGMLDDFVVDDDVVEYAPDEDVVDSDDDDEMYEPIKKKKRKKKKDKHRKKKKDKKKHKKKKKKKKEKREQCEKMDIPNLEVIEEIDNNNNNQNQINKAPVNEDVKKQLEEKVEKLNENQIEDKKEENKDKGKEEKDDDDEDDEANECVICMDGKKEYLCIPCGHLCLCGTCKDGIKQCPMCRADNVTVIKLFK